MQDDNQAAMFNKAVFVSQTWTTMCEGLFALQWRGLWQWISWWRHCCCVYQLHWWVTLVMLLIFMNGNALVHQESTVITCTKNRIYNPHSSSVQARVTSCVRHSATAQKWRAFHTSQKPARINGVYNNWRSSGSYSSSFWLHTRSVAWLNQLHAWKLTRLTPE